MPNVVSMRRVAVLMVTVAMSWNCAYADPAAGLAGVQASGTFSDPATLVSGSPRSIEPTSPPSTQSLGTSADRQDAPIRMAMLADGRPVVGASRFSVPEDSRVSNDERPASTRMSLVIFILTTLVGYQLHRRHRFLKPRGFSGV
jgi:hypothetical protein